MALHATDVPTQDQQTNGFIRKQNLTWNAVLLGDFSTSFIFAYRRTFAICR
jgi:hypothetical protein